MPPTVRTTTLEAFFGNPWFEIVRKWGQAVLLTVCLPLLSYASLTMANLAERTAKLEQINTESRTTQLERAKDNENFQSYVVKSFTDQDMELSRLVQGQAQTREELAKLTGILDEMRRVAVARRSSIVVQ